MQQPMLTKGTWQSKENKENRSDRQRFLPILNWPRSSNHGWISLSVARIEVRDLNSSTRPEVGPNCWLFSSIDSIRCNCQAIFTIHKYLQKWGIPTIKIGSSGSTMTKEIPNLFSMYPRKASVYFQPQPQPLRRGDRGRRTSTTTIILKLQVTKQNQVSSQTRPRKKNPEKRRIRQRDRAVKRTWEGRDSACFVLFEYLVNAQGGLFESSTIRETSTIS